MGVQGISVIMLNTVALYTIPASFGYKAGRKFFYPVGAESACGKGALGVLRSYMMRAALCCIKNPARMAEVAVCGWNGLFLHDRFIIPCYTSSG